MGITIVKKKVAPVLEPIEKLSAESLSKEELERIADLYGTLEDQIKAIEANPIFAQFELVKKELTSRIGEEAEPTDTLAIEGDHWVLDIGVAAKSPAEVVNMPLLAAVLGQDVFYKVAKVNLSDVRKYCTPAQVEKVLNEDTGYTPRRKIVSKYKG